MTKRTHHIIGVKGHIAPDGNELRVLLNLIGFVKKNFAVLSNIVLYLLADHFFATLIAS